MSAVTEKDLKEFASLSSRLLEEIGKDMVGQKDVVESAVIAMIAGGNVLLEGVPGVGKTRLVRAMGRVFGLPFSRIQFTPDLMPADVTGTNIIEKQPDGTSAYRFQRGPIFSSIVLADEINRATPKTQSALLEAMQEHTVTAGGQDYKLQEPFFVLATQNPVEQEGTYPLPEAQLDRFMFKLLVTYPKLDELRSIVLMTQDSEEEVSERVLDAETLLRMRACAKAIPVTEDVLEFALRLVSATHPDSDCTGNEATKWLRMGASPRAAQALLKAAKVRALMSGRYNVSFADVEALAVPVLRHRIRLNFEAIAARKKPDELIEAIIREQKAKRKGR